MVSDSVMVMRSRSRQQAEKAVLEARRSRVAEHVRNGTVYLQDIAAAEGVSTTTTRRDLVALELPVINKPVIKKVVPTRKVETRKVRCSGTNKSGKNCGSWARSGSQNCQPHSGQVTEDV